MKESFEKLNKLEETNSTNEKEEIIEKTVKENQKVRQYLQITLGDGVYNVGKKTIRKALNINYDENFKDIGLEVEKYIKEGNKQTGLMNIGEETKNITFSEFSDHAYILTKTEKEQKQIRILKDIFNNTSPVEGKWYARALVKDLNAGAGVKTVNNALNRVESVETVNTFDVSLAEAIEIDGSHKEQLNELNYPVYGEPKRDGVRLIIRNVDSSGEPLGHIEAKTRNNKKVFIIDDILDEIEEEIEDMNFSLDGEIVGPDFQKLMTQLRRKEDYDEDMDIEFVVFDIRYLETDNYSFDDLAWNTEIIEERRKEILKKYIPFNKMDNIELVDWTVLNNSEEVVTYFNKVKDMYEEEGAMVKEIEKSYTNDRHSWYKLKPIKDLDLEITGYEIADDGKYVDQVTSITVRDSSGIMETNVGSGFTDADREKFTEMGDELIGKIAEIHFDSYSKGQNDEKYSLRFPRFIALRNDKEKAQEADINE